MWPNYRDAGARCLVTSGLVLSPEVIATTAAGVPDTALVVCRLRARPDTIRERMFRRARGYGPPLAGDELVGRSAAVLSEAADDSIREAEIMQRLDLGDFVIDTDDLSIAAVASAVLAHAGDWPGL
jgi:hypothetical protein